MKWICYLKFKLLISKVRYIKVNSLSIGFGKNWFFRLWIVIWFCGC